jgi:hypothetical protein
VVAFLDRKYGNSIGLCELISFAVERGVQVYFYDTAITTEPAKIGGMKLRNEAMGKVFRENSSGEEAGAVALVGGAHLYAE